MQVNHERVEPAQSSIKSASKKGEQSSERNRKEAYALYRVRRRACHRGR